MPDAVTSALYLTQFEVPPHVMQTHKLARRILSNLSLHELVKVGTASRTLELPARVTLAERPRLLNFFGGSDSKRELSTAMSVDLVSSRWEPLPPMSECRILAAGAIMAGWLYLCGGCHESRYSASVERFDPVQRCWEASVPMLQPRGGAVAVAIEERFLYVCGGRAGPSSYLDTAERFALESQCWEAIPAMGTRCTSAIGAGNKGCVYVCGGYSHPAYLSKVQRFDPGLETWALAAEMPEARAFAAGAATSTHVFACGGRNEKGVLNSVDILDKGQDAWATLNPPMLEKRCFAVACASGGFLYVFGGFDGKRYSHSIERCDPSAEALQRWQHLERELPQGAPLCWATVGLTEGPALRSSEVRATLANAPLA